MMRRREFIKVSALAGAVGAASYASVGALDTKPAARGEPTVHEAPTATPTETATESPTPMESRR